MVILLRDVMSSLASRCDSYSADSTTEIMARTSANLRINHFFQKTNFIEKKARNPLERCLEKQSNMVKALTGSYSLKRREAIEKPKFPDPSNLLFFHLLSSRLQYSTQEIRVCIALVSIRKQLQQRTNMILRKRRAASLISKPQTKNQYEENCPEMNSVSFL